jgi:hypothetical protein
MQVMRMASAEKMELGDTVEFEAGGTVYAVRTAGVAMAAQPFVRVTVHPGEVWAVRYQLATARDVQSFDGLDSIAPEMPVAAVSDGRLEMENGSHQEIALSRRVGKGVVEAAVYRDAIAGRRLRAWARWARRMRWRVRVRAGWLRMGRRTALRFWARDTRARGVRLTVSEPMTANLWAALEVETGAALAPADAERRAAGGGRGGTPCEDAESVTAEVKGKVLRTGPRCARRIAGSRGSW